MSTITITIPGRLPRLSLPRPFRRFKSSRRAQLGLKIFAGLTIVVLLVTIVWPIVEHKIAARQYDLKTSETALLPASDKIIQNDISRDQKTGAYQFQNRAPGSSAPASGNAVSADTTMLKATFPYLASKGVTVTDPVNKIDFTVKPLFDLAPARQASSHVYYPFLNGNGKLVYSPQAANVLEDLVLSSATGNEQHFDYDLGLKASGLAAKLAPDGSVGIYGSSISMLGNVSTGSASDAARLEKARARAPKDKLLFTIPAPTVRDSSGVKSKVKAAFSLRDAGATLRVNATNLKQAIYPLTIDPTVSVQSVSQLFRGTNGESNVDFSTSGNGSVRRGAVTGGVFSYSPGWTTNSNSLTTGHFLGSSTISNGYMYVGGGLNGTSTTNQSTLEYAPISSPTVGAWQTASLPTSTPLSQFKLLSYNGYLYALGGSNGATVGNGGCTNPTSNVYYNPTQPNGAIAASWTATTSIPVTNPAVGLCSFGAAIYNNTIYVIGGQTASGAQNGTNKVYYASILPNGAIGTWNTSAVSLPVSLYGADVQIYNGYIYVIGGYGNAASTTTLTTIYRAALSSDGSIYGSTSADWKSLPNTFATPNGGSGLANAGGGSFSTVNDGYMYVSGGCKAVTTSTQTCTSINSATFIAQINADGTLGPWSQISSSTTVPEVGGSLQVFANNLYLIGGCNAMSTTNFVCNTAGGNLQTQSYATITGAGQIGPVSSNNTVLTTTGNLPNGVYQAASVINNGYIYVIGGCVTNSCSTNTSAGVDTSSGVYYAPLNADGSIGTWTKSTRLINGANTSRGLGAIDGAAAVYENYIYIFGGYNYSGGTTANGFVSANNSASNVIWYAPIGSNGDITSDFAPYTTTRLSQGTYSMAAVADRGYVYGFGGCNTGANSAGCSNYYSTGYQLKVGLTGPISLTVGTSAVANLPNGTEVPACTSIGTGVGKLNTLLDCYPGLAAMGATIYNGYVYLIGGASGNSPSGNGQSVIIEYGKINANGTITSWNYASNYLPISSSLGGYYAALRRASAYASNGYLYVVGGHDGDTATGVLPATSPNISIGKINLATGDISSTSTSSQVLPYPEWNGATAFANGTVYVIGGCYAGSPPTSCSYTTTPNSGLPAPNSKIQTFQIYNAANAGTATWATGTAYASAYGNNNVTGPSSVAVGGYIYVAGGCSTYNLTILGNCTATVGNTAYAPLNPDGSVGSWTGGPGLPANLGYGCMVANNGYLYYIGGVSAINTPSAAVYISQIGANGVPGAWTTTGVAALPANAGHLGCDTFGGRIYVAGGTTNSTATAEGTDLNNVYYVQPSTSTGGFTSWSTGTAFTTGRRDASVVVASGYLYVIGGYSNGGTATYYNDVQFNSINPSTGALGGTWGTSRALPMPVTQASVSAANGYLFISGGATGATATTCQASTYIASVNNTGEVSSWTQNANATNFTTARFGAGSAYYNGYYYVMGGYGCAGSAIVSANVVQYGGEQSQTMNSFFTRYADLTGNSLPQKFVAFVTNAQLNSTDIESWKMTYVSSASATTPSWGKATTLSPLTSGTVYNVYAYDGSGANVKLAQYVSLAFSISMEKSFAFTDDSQPYVSSYYMYYSPYVKNRLRNGKIFQDQQQQGFDLNLQ